MTCIWTENFSTLQAELTLLDNYSFSRIKFGQKACKSVKISRVVDSNSAREKRLPDDGLIADIIRQSKRIQI